MARPFNFGEINLTADGEPSPANPEPDTPFRIGVLGDFSGRAANEQGIATKRAVFIDRDNFDEVMAKIAPELTLPMGDAKFTLTFADLDDFHPDRLFQTVPIFDRLREVRARLADSDTFAAAAEELGLKAAPAAAGKPSSLAQSARDVAGSVASSGGLLDAMIGEGGGGAAAVQPSRVRDPIQDFVRQVTEPHLVAKADPRQAEVVAAIDRALSAQMRSLLHVPAFQALEAAWRGMFFLVRRSETSPQLKLYLVDISREELGADLAASSDLKLTGLYRLLVDKTVGTPGADPWALLVGNYQFGATVADSELLGRLAKVASAAGAPFLAAAGADILGCESLAETPHPRQWTHPPSAADAAAWAALRHLTEASSVGLALPRFLLRMPYGKKSDAIESFDFEEMPEGSAHEDYLWGNPAFACAALLAQSFNDEGWDIRPGSHSEVGDLPLHVYQHGGESELQPCAEVWLTEDAAMQILDNGLMPLASLKGQDAAKLVRFQSIAEPLQALAGPWNR